MTSTKESAEQAFQAFLVWCRAWRLNMDAMAEVGSDGDTMFFVRLRPWENKPKAGSMYVGWGKELNTAARMACKAVVAKEDLDLDYAYRPWRARTLGATSSATPVDIPF